MRGLRLGVIAATAAAASALGWASGCSSSNAGAPNDAGVDAGASTCPACTTDQDCNGGVCVQVGDTYCAPACPNGNECDPDRACVAASTFSGQQVSVCLPRGGDVCGVGNVPAQDAGPPSETCGALVGPDVKAGCSCSSGKTCAANGCYGGWWCNTTTNRCQSPPSTCVGAGDGGGTGVPYDAGGPVTGTVGEDGGALSRLYFAIVGDTRPANIDDTAGYPTVVIDTIFGHMAAMSVVPPFAVSTGDYQFSSPSGTQAAPQIDLYLAARGKWPGVEFPTMGNHECTGMTNSNCGAGTANGVTNTYSTYLSKMLAGLGQPNPWYEIDVNAPDGAWTSKFLFVAANAWVDAQATWLDQAMARDTTYTFIVRHEPAAANTAPGVTPSEAIMAKHPYTLAIVGHTHSYAHYTGSRQVLVGNGGAPITTGGKDFGYGVVSMRADGSGALDVDMLHYQTGLADPSFHFAVEPDGSAAP